MARQVTGVVLRLLDHDWHVLADVAVPARGSDPARRADFVVVGPPGVFVVACRAVDTAAGATPPEGGVAGETPVLAELSRVLRDALPVGRGDVKTLLSLVGPDQLAVTEVGDGVLAGTPSALVRELSSRRAVLDDAQVRSLATAVLDAGTTPAPDVADRPEPVPPTPVAPTAVAPATGQPPTATPAGDTSPAEPAAPQPSTAVAPAGPDGPDDDRTGSGGRSRGVRIAVALAVATLLVAGGTGWVVLADPDLSGAPAAAPSSGSSAAPSEAAAPSPSPTEPGSAEPSPTQVGETASATPGTPAPSATPAPSTPSTADFATVRRWGRTAVVPAVDALPSVRLSMSRPRQTGADDSGDDGGQVRWVTRTVVRNLGARPLPPDALQWGLRGSDEAQDWSAGEAGASPSLRTRIAPGSARVVRRTWVLPEGVEPSGGSVRLGRVQVTWQDGPGSAG